MTKATEEERANGLDEALTAIAMLSRPGLDAVDRRLARLARQHGDEAYAAFLRVICHLTFDPADAHEHWRNILRHTRELARLLGRPVDYRIGVADYFVSKEPQLHNPTVLEIDAYRATEASTMRDALTGLYNFRFLTDALPREIGRATRTEQPLGLCFMDVDFFKAYNDQHGHAAGNEALQRIAKNVLEAVRSMDLVCRFGGEELTVVLPATDKVSAMRIATRLIASVEALGLATPAPGGVVTASAGVACFPEDAGSAEELLRAADAALLAAKQRGKNRVEAFVRNRRAHPRERREFIGVCSLGSGEPVYVLGVDISPGGAFFEAPARLPAGGKVDLSLVFPMAERFGQMNCQARIVRCEPVNVDKFGVGACFSYMDPVERQKLIRMAAFRSNN